MALHAVELKGLTRFVSLESHLGHVTFFGAPRIAFLSVVLCSGGAIPYFFNFFFAAKLNQSVVQAGSYWVMILYFFIFNELSLNHPLIEE